MDNLHVAPLSRQILRRQPPMTPLRNRLTTQQHGPHVEQAPVNGLLDGPLDQQVDVPGFIFLPRNLFLL